MVIANLLFFEWHANFVIWSRDRSINLFLKTKLPPTMFDTVWPADSAEFCPKEGLTDVFAVGTYKLEEKEEKVNGHQQRRGQCILFKMNEDETDL